MKIPSAMLAALLLVAMCQGAEAQLGDFDDAASSRKPDSVPIFCCFSYTLRTIARSSITSAYMTSRRCNMPGVILVTKKQRHVCADPRARWVQNYLEHFQTLKN
ncbi:PREDICTED: C-C motif chemokine 3-like [Buceros rhinoceros silvestris]|uniref:C-C motif chemokine 3-like n=1 Tax=Buceros rhinoceros silvestris TaxID=175836 RepID=UPI00052906B4|nr:PREDICTED: C-C motif chemokine 3-like [Buceros rhinoceros silvestris]